MATQPQPDTPAPSQPGQPTEAPPEIVPTGPDVDYPAPMQTPDGAPDAAPGQPI